MWLWFISIFHCSIIHYFHVKTYYNIEYLLFNIKNSDAQVISKHILWASTENPWSNFIVTSVFENEVQEVAYKNITNQEPKDI